jgi:hypothetical protein
MVELLEVSEDDVADVEDVDRSVLAVEGTTGSDVTNR